MRLDVSVILFIWLDLPCAVLELIVLGKMTLTTLRCLFQFIVLCIAGYKPSFSIVVMFIPAMNVGYTTYTLARCSIEMPIDWQDTLFWQIVSLTVSLVEIAVIVWVLLRVDPIGRPLFRPIVKSNRLKFPITAA